LPEHKSNRQVWKKEQKEDGRLGHEPSSIVDNIKLLSGYWNNLGVNTVCKIPPERQRTQPEQKHKYTHDKTPDQNLSYHFQHFIRIVQTGHVLPPVITPSNYK
jgi:hypothetical protein